ncbi:MAG: FIST C-terminal domain-containing protein [Pseudomonadota bacterium]
MYDAPPDFLAVHADASADLTGLNSASHQTACRAVHGATSCKGVMASEAVRLNQRAFGVFAIWDPDGDFGTCVVAKGHDPEAASSAATSRAIDAAGRPGEAPDLIWLSTSPGNEEAVLAGIMDVVGPDVPIVGGSCADNDLSGGWAVFDGEQVIGEGIAVSVLFPSGNVSVSFQNGYAPTDKSGVVTEGAGRHIAKIDDKPAAEFCVDWGGARAREIDETVTILSDSTFAPLGRQVTDVADVPFFLLIHPASAHPDGSIEVFADISEGETLHQMTGSVDTLINRASRVARNATEALPTGNEVVGALMVYCGGCMLAVEDRMDEVVAGVNQSLGGAPFLGIFTFGEQGTDFRRENHHGNLMISCITFAA